MFPPLDLPPTVSRNEKNRAMAMVISGRVIRRMALCHTARQKRSSSVSIREKLSNPTHLGGTVNPLQAFMAM